ncbi:basic helix-loop-helix domain-containing protein KNAG_0E00420 [Huiozyma naganishii CBS 8797]|uniref:BHLH domain-containing protein n=1 Tax=Huiozyma naganishii (strain ATCC MYA-139 / BCRC 22969 / CBS 8797 / KCTC 17520 / NBRC 10181 / NCYC 3082 / Yp74L-3) TaxID=1071383 RepID=J7R623_HUIN7|nr:hypothetical protein KNAG_0E00420 [Kazachstania naganishii CBS 8797]CCK70310.1 hypothetical protein KNAG_0E00420 [Kazachstania naganishii CBS 8797]
MNSLIANTNMENSTGKSAAPSFDAWMFQPEQLAAAASGAGNFKLGSKRSSLSLADSDSSSWFEPLENILSSASTSSMGSPLPVEAGAGADVAVKYEDPFALQLNDLLKKEEDNCDAAMTPRVKAPRKRLTPHQKEAHNKIEKRYRININMKITKLQQIIPWVASEQTAFETDHKLGKQQATSTRLNKSMILEKAVDYILYLQNNERLYEMEVMRLKNELETYKRTAGSK